MSRSVITRHASRTPHDAEGVIDFREVRDWIRSGSIVKHFFRYQDVVMRTHLLEMLPKPFLSALVARSMSRGRCTIEDEFGVVVSVNVLTLASLFRALIRDWLGKGPLIKATRLQIASILGSAEVRRHVVPLDISRRPLYLRTDLVFGLRSGGSVGHIAGVLNNLGKFTAAPLFVTTDEIPTVSSATTVVVRPTGRYRDFDTVALVAFNGTVLERSVAAVGGNPPAFVYQRYAMFNFVGLELARRYAVPFVLEYNGSEVWASRVWGGRPVSLEALASEIEQMNLRAADLRVVVSKVLSDELIAAGIDPDGILVNPNGVDTEMYSPSVDGNSVRERLGLEGKLVVGFIGTFGPWHGAEVLAGAFTELLRRAPDMRDRVRLLMIGDGDRFAATQQVIDRDGLGDATIFVGRTRQEEGPLYLAACDVLVAPHVPNSDGSRFFGSPTKLFEYMAMGKGIVASRLEQIGEVLEHDRTAWLVEPGSVEDLVNGLRRLLNDAELRERLGRAAREDVVAKYTWREHTRRIVERVALLGVDDPDA